MLSHLSTTTVKLRILKTNYLQLQKMKEKPIMTKIKLMKSCEYVFYFFKLIMKSNN